MGGAVNKIVGGASNMVFGKPGGELGNFNPQGVNSPAFAIGTGQGAINLNRGTEFQNLLSELMLSGGRQTSSLDYLAGQVTPGFGRLTEAAKASAEASIGAFNASRRKAIGDLRENLARRRVSGSSFASDALSRAEKEFALGEAQLKSQQEMIGAEMFLKELDTNFQLTQARYKAEQSAFAQQIDQGNFELGIAATMASGVSSVMAGNAQTLAQVEADYAGGRAGLIGAGLGYAVGGPVGAMIGAGIGG